MDLSKDNNWELAEQCPQCGYHDLSYLVVISGDPYKKFCPGCGVFQKFTRIARRWVDSTKWFDILCLPLLLLDFSCKGKWEIKRIEEDIKIVPRKKK